MASEYKPLSQDSFEVNVIDEDSGAGEKRRAPKGTFFLTFSLLFISLVFVVVLQGSHELPVTVLFSQRIFHSDSWSSKPEKSPQLSPSSEGILRCPPHHPQLASPPAPVNVWRPLGIPLTNEIQAWLESPERGLNLTRAEKSVASDNVIFLIEAFRPAKRDVLNYLSDPTTIAPPTQYARVTIHHGGKFEPVVKDYLVGPLPISQNTSMTPLNAIYHQPNIPFNARGLTQWTEIPLFLARAVAPISSVMETLFGATVHGLSNDTLVAGMSAPFSFDGSFRRFWVTWRRNTAGSFLLPVNFYMYVDLSGTDSSQWKILKLSYHGQLFTSMSEFQEAFNNGTLISHPEQADPSIDLSWTQRKRPFVNRDLDHLPGPRSVSFAGLRFRVDRERQYVSWMGWGMYLGFERDMGLSFWDVRFRGERIIYELSPQEAMAQYGGNDPLQATTAWQDRYFGMGGLTRDMIPHYDCPQEAVYLPATTYSALGHVQVKRAICIFEQDTGKPLSRHFGYMDGEFGAVKSYVLTVRSTTTVGNYDYIFDYTFYLDGTMEVRLSASGYVQGGYWTPQQEGYGTRIRDTSMGNLHDHVINYKVDLDIAGTSNSLLKTTTKQEVVTHPWLDDDWGQEVIQQKITKEYIANENDALLKYPVNFQGGYALVNQDVKNAWGYPKGYAIHAGYSPIHNVAVGSKRLLKNANWARYNLAVSRRKETELSSSSMWNLQLPGDPVIDFLKFFDGENITQQDLVVWINVGTHHLPQAEDSPNTKANIATSSFVLTPLNYFDMDVGMESRNAILLYPPKSEGGRYTYENYDVKQDLTCLPDAPAPFEYEDAQRFDMDGNHVKDNNEELRRMSEMYLRVALGA